jgi:type I restriction enzyme S subunit
VSEWRSYKIGELGKVITGKTPPSSQPELFVGDTPFLTPSDMTDDGRDVITERFVSTAWDPKRRQLLPEGSTCVVCIGATIGKVCMTNRPSHTNQQVNSIVVDTERFDPGFVFYAMRTLGAELRARAAGAATPILNKTAFSEVAISAPPLEVQRRIASVLGAYDDLIEVNRRRVAVLEEMAQRLFEEWFVRFRFPGNEGVPIVETADGSLPEGWSWGTLGDLLEERRDITKPGAHLAERRYVPIECIGRRTLALAEHQPWENAQSSLQLFEEGDLLFGAMRAYFHKVAPAPFAGITRSTCFVLRPRSPALAGYALMTLFQDATIAFAAANSSGSTIPYAKWAGVLEQMVVPFPDEELLASFNSKVWPMMQLVMRFTETKERLASARDLLLPRLISGQLSVDVADRQLEDVA